MRELPLSVGSLFGIDTVAHEAAQKCKGKTIAVVGCGLKHIYPEENRELFHSIIENGGCIVSEYEPEEPVDMKNFPKRNRIVSGLSDGVLVVEAGYRSGSIITGKLGLEQGKKVFCLPRDVGISNGIGSNELIQKGARLVTSPQDILQEYGIYPEKQDDKINIYKKHKGKMHSKEDYAEEEINEMEETIYIPKEYVNIYQFTSYTPQNIQYFVNKSGLKIAEVTQKLIMLELQGYIKSMPRKLLY